MAPRDDLGALYAKNMEHFGCGTALFQPVAGADMRPPCIGYLDDNKRWNLIANIDWLSGDDPTHRHGALEGSFKPLEREPRKMEQLGIEWRPRTSIGVRQWLVDANGQILTTGIPINADAHIVYKSNTDFGAVLIAQKPITLTSYHDETLFQSWLAANKHQLSTTHGAALRRHGLYLVTRTYTAPGCSINAWRHKDKEANMSLKVKASMLGELGEDLKWTERLTDKDWTHYYGKDQGKTVVVFFDGIEVPPSAWWWEGVKGKFGKSDSPSKFTEASDRRTKSQERRPSPPRGPSEAEGGLPREDQGLQSEDIWGSSTHLRWGSLAHDGSISRGRQPSSERYRSLGRSLSTPKRSPRYLDYEQESPASDDQTVRLSPSSVSKVRTTRSPPQRSSTVSDATNLSLTEKGEVKAPKVEVNPPDSQPRNLLQRKPASPSLRHPT